MVQAYHVTVRGPNGNIAVDVTETRRENAFEALIQLFRNNPPDVNFDISWRKIQMEEVPG
jgi:hypothetical protein